MGNGILNGKKGIVFGALNEDSIAWRTAEKIAEEGGRMVLTNSPVALKFGSIKSLAEKTGSTLIAADATSVEDLGNLVDKTVEEFGGRLDFVLHAVGMSPNIRKERPYCDLDYNFFNKTLDISALSFHKLLQVLYKKDAMNEGGSIVALTYIAADRVMPGYSDMADAKAMLQSITRNFGYIFGKEKKVRINTISQSPTMTTAGKGIKGMDSLFGHAEKASPLGNASAEDCAGLVTALFSDYTRKVTLQNIYNDGGFSSVLPFPL